LIFPPRLLRPRQDLQFGRQARTVHDQGMVTGDVHRRWQTPERPRAGVADRRDLAVHDPPGAYDLPAVGGGDRLVSKADAEDRRTSAEAADALDAHPGLRRCARTGRDDDTARLHPLDLFDRDLVVASDDRIRTQLAQILDEVERERVVVVDDQQHGASARRKGLPVDAGRLDDRPAKDKEASGYPRGWNFRCTSRRYSRSTCV